MTKNIVPIKIDIESISYHANLYCSIILTAYFKNKEKVHGLVKIINSSMYRALVVEEIKEVYFNN